MVKDRKFVPCINIEPFHHLAVLNFCHLFNAALHISKLITNNSEIFEFFVEFVPFVEQISANDFVQVQISRFEALI